jgi:hypothetical protein
MKYAPHVIGYLNKHLNYHVEKPNSNPLYSSIYQLNEVQEIISLSTTVGVNKKLYVTINMQNRHR